MRYLIKFSYDGTKFKGFQRQKEYKSVQGTLEKVLSDYFNEKIIIKGSGRTDAKVHALNQGAHFEIAKRINKKDIKNINKLLNKEININNYKLVKDDFHARYNVIKKTYKYKVYCGKDKRKEGYYYQINYKLDIKKMQEAAQIYLGTHDFHNFVSGYRDNYITTIFKAKVKKKKDTIEFTFTGIGFYRYMVRHLVGTLIDIGRKKVEKNVIREMLNNPKVNKELSVAPPEGLYLIDIKYKF